MADKDPMQIEQLTLSEEVANKTTEVCAELDSDLVDPINKAFEAFRHAGLPKEHFISLGLQYVANVMHSTLMDYIEGNAIDTVDGNEIRRVADAMFVNASRNDKIAPFPELRPTARNQMLEAISDAKTTTKQ